MNSTERRSSRSIKRKRFDDEIVDYASPAINRNPRSRTQSHSSHNVLADTNTSDLPVPPQSEAAPGPSVLDNISLTVATIEVGNASEIKPDQTADVPVTKTSEVITVSSTFAQAVHTKEPSPVLIASPSMSVPRESTNVFGLSPIMAAERKVNASKKKNGRRSGFNQMSTKDLGRWKPVDDLALIIGIQQTNDIKMVHRGVKFSCKFTLNELHNRWYALLYEEAVSRIAVAAMRNLHPQLVENVQRRALFSSQEEELLGTIKSNESPSPEIFSDMMNKNPSVFYSARTPKVLLSHWQLMKQYGLLPDQALKAPGKDTSVLSFSDNEELINDVELSEGHNEALDKEIKLVDRHNKREIRQLEHELGRWNVLVDSMTGLGFPTEFDRQTLAVMRGRLVRYLMRSREITIGRATRDCNVDVDLCLEGPALKVSRKQGTIKLRSNADFFLTNEGKRPIYVDGIALLKGYKTRLSHQCTIDVSGLRFTFLVNFDLINAIQQESAKMNTPLT